MSDPQTTPSKTRLLGNRAFCLECHQKTPGIHTRPGKTSMLVMSFAMGIIPGFFYLRWREHATKVSCSHCGSEHLVRDDDSQVNAL